MTSTTVRLDKADAEEQAPALTVPYPDDPAMRALFRAPLLLYRLGLGPLVGQLFMVVTTTGRKSGLPRRAMVEYQRYGDKKVAIAAWPDSDWYRNLQADPRATIQTADGVEHVVVRRVTDEAELADVYDNTYAKAGEELRQIWAAMGIELDRESFLANREAFHLLLFQPVRGEQHDAQPPLAEDLLWVWPALLGGLVALGGLLLWGRRRNR